MDLVNYLESKGVHVKMSGPNEAHMACWWCGEDPNKRGRLYVNVDPHMEPKCLFECKLCGETGALNKIRKYWGDPIIKSGEEGYYDPSFPLIIRESVNFYHDNLLHNAPDALKYLFDRGITYETIKEFKLGYASGGLKTFLKSKDFKEDDLKSASVIKQDGIDALTNHIVIPYFVSGNAVSFRGRNLGNFGPKYITLTGHKAYLFNSDVVWCKQSELVIAEGELDAILMNQLGLSAVGLPGANSWQDAWDSYVDATMVSRLYICFDTDKAGKDASEKIALRFNGRAKIIELPFEENEGNDFTDWISHGGTIKGFRELTKSAIGGILISVREAYERWTDLEGNPNLKGLKFGFPLFDEAISPGLLPGQVMVTISKTGAGKTISLLNFMHRMKKEQPSKKFLFVSLEQTRNEWFERARRIHKFYQPSATIKDTIMFWDQNFMMVDKNRVDEEEFLNCVEQYEYEMGTKPDLIAIDYLGYWAQSFKGNTYEKASAAIMSCKAIAKEIGIPIYTPHQVSRLTDAGNEPELSSARDSGVIEESCDFLMALWANDQKKGTDQSDRTGEISLKILKSRHGGVGTRINLLFTPKTLAIVPDTDPLAYVAEREIKLAKIGDDLDTVVYRNLTGWNGVVVSPEIQEEMLRLKQEGYM